MVLVVAGAVVVEVVVAAMTAVVEVVVVTSEDGVGEADVVVTAWSGGGSWS